MKLGRSGGHCLHPGGTRHAAHRLGTGPAPGNGCRRPAWGPGADWLLDAMPAMLGADDRPEDFVARSSGPAPGGRANGPGSGSAAPASCSNARAGGARAESRRHGGHASLALPAMAVRRTGARTCAGSAPSACGCRQARSLGGHPVVGVAQGRRRGRAGQDNRFGRPGGGQARGDQPAALGRGGPQAAVAARYRSLDVGRGQAACLRRRRCGLGGRLSPAALRRLRARRPASRRRGHARIARALPGPPPPRRDARRHERRRPARRGPRNPARDYRAI